MIQYHKTAGEIDFQLLKYEDDPNEIVHFSNCRPLDQARILSGPDRIKNIGKGLGAKVPEFIYPDELENGILQWPQSGVADFVRICAKGTFIEELEDSDIVKFILLTCLSIVTLLFVNAWGPDNIVLILIPVDLDISSILAALFFDILILSPLIYGMWRGLRFIRQWDP